jgi:type I restriction enzyme S subunit
MRRSSTAAEGDPRQAGEAGGGDSGGDEGLLLPPLHEQRRIAAILDQADALRAKRREALAQLDALKQSIFIEMFGDMAKNPMAWQWQPLGSIAEKFSDGPFGSNLKSEHYVESGIRVVRLQNIGVGKFINDNKAFVSQHHYETIKKHECKPGDVLVGTMGDPNLRACILPNSIPLAINKADCVQIRVNTSRANSVFICALLNHPSTELLAQDLKHGQTRVRISMGSLRGLNVPIPPLSIQKDFSLRICELDLLRSAHIEAMRENNRLFESLQHRAFRGEL